MKKDNEIVYKVINLGKTGKQREMFFEWALSHQLFKKDELKSFTSRIKLVYTNQLHKKEPLSIVLALENNKPIGILLCEDTMYNHILLKKDAENKQNKIGEASLMGFLSFYVLPNHRKKGVASKLMEIIEMERAPLFIDNIKDGYPILMFEARDGAIKLIKGSKYSYPLDCTIHQIILRDKIKILTEHVFAILENNQASMYYSNPLIHKKKEILDIEQYIKNKDLISKISVNELLDISPIKQEDIKNKIVKKIPTLKPRIKK